MTTVRNHEPLTTRKGNQSVGIILLLKVNVELSYGTKCN